MKKLMFVAVAALTTAVFADRFNHADVSAKTEGYYDVTLTTKSLQHATKAKKSTYTTSTRKGSAYAQFTNDYAKVSGYAGFSIVELTGITKVYPEAKEIEATKITMKYTYFDYTEKEGKKTYKSKVVSQSNKGVYDAKSGKVYLWNTANKIEKPEQGALKDAKSKGYVAYEVPLAMDKQFVKTDDNKAAGGFVGANAIAADGSGLYLEGLTAFGSGTYDAKKGYVKTISGNVAAKNDKDAKYGAYGTWKLNKDTKSYDNLEAALVKKGCVELINEVVVK